MPGTSVVDVGSCSEDVSSKLVERVAHLVAENFCGFHEHRVLALVVNDVGDSDEIAVYRDYEAALRDVPNIPILRAFPYQVVELDEI